MKRSAWDGIDLPRLLDEIEESGNVRHAIVSGGLNVESIMASIKKWRAGEKRVTIEFFEKGKPVVLGIEEALISYHSARLEDYRAREAQDFATPRGDWIRGGRSKDARIRELEARVRELEGAQDRDSGAQSADRDPEREGDTDPASDRPRQGTTGWKPGRPVPDGFMEFGGELVDVR